MTPERHERIKELFLAAADMPADRRSTFLEAKCGNEAQLLAEIQSLLDYHSQRTISTKASADSPTAKDLLTSRNKNRGSEIHETGRAKPVFTAVVLMAICLIAAAFWASGKLRGSVRERLQEQLRTVLSADINSLDHWISWEKRELQNWATHEDVKREIGELVRISQSSDSPRDDLLSSAAYERLIYLLSPLKNREGVFGFGVIDTKGMCLLHVKPKLVGTEVAPSGGVYLRRVMLGETIFARPAFKYAHVVGFEVNKEVPLVGFGTPVWSPDGQIMAGLTVGLLADDEVYRRRLEYTDWPDRRILLVR